MVIWFSSMQSATDHAVLIVNRLCRCQAAQMDVTKSDFSQMCQSRSDLIKNAVHFARIDLDRSRFVRFWKRMQPV